MGGGTDFPEFYRSTTPAGGAVLSTTIDKYIYIILRSRYDRRIVLSWTRKETVDSVDEIQHELVRETLRATGIRDSIEIITTADIPSEGSGLGSSSALTVGLLKTFYTYRDVDIPDDRLAAEAAHIEMNVLKKPVGKQDAYAAAFGGLRRYDFLSDDSVRIHPLRLSPTDLRKLDGYLLMYFTGRTRSSTDLLARQRENAGVNLPVLEAIRRGVDRACRLIRKGNLDEFGRLLHEAWTLKRRLAEGITDAEIDEMYDRALGAGATGGKILGAGGGGFLLLVCPPPFKAAVRKALRGYAEMPFGFESRGAKVLLNTRQRNWQISVTDERPDRRQSLTPGGDAAFT